MSEEDNHISSTISKPVKATHKANSNHLQQPKIIASETPTDIK